MRFEVLVTTPHFEMGHYGKEKDVFSGNVLDTFPSYPDERRKTVFQPILVSHKFRTLNHKIHAAALLGFKESRRGTLSPQQGQAVLTEDIVTWIFILDDVHTVHNRILMTMQYHLYVYTRLAVKELSEADKRQVLAICISRKTRPWEFKPPEIVRPVASTTMSCLLLMAHRMSMIVTDLRLDDVILQASGRSRSFLTSRVRGLGMVVEYSTNYSYFPRWDSFFLWLRVPTKSAEMVRCWYFNGQTKAYIVR
ncbi:hypothetical protein J1614_005040 [Plenodomus biglobosus]|nr:hypothetical protein J1614_005040 [Plenodomus biglobosus]